MQAGAPSERPTKKSKRNEAKIPEEEDEDEAKEDEDGDDTEL